MSTEKSGHLLASNFQWWMLFLGVLGERCLLYELPDCFELEERDHIQISRRRIFFTDVVMVTQHHYRPVAIPFCALTLALLCGLMALIFLQSRHLEGVGWFFLLVFCVPLTALAVLRIIVGTTVVSIQGLRASASIRFSFARQQADRLFTRAVETVEATQAALRPATTATEPSDEHAGTGAETGGHVPQTVSSRAHGAPLDEG